MASATDRIAWAEVRKEGGPADPHHLIGGHRRQRVRGIDVGQHGDGHGMGRVQVHDRPGRRPCVGESGMERQLLRRCVPREDAAVRVDAGETGRIEAAQRRVGGRRDPADVAETNRDVAGRACREAALE